jgi:hypothetical protein
MSTTHEERVAQVVATKFTGEFVDARLCYCEELKTLVGSSGPTSASIFSSRTSVLFQFPNGNRMVVRVSDLEPIA